MRLMAGNYLLEDSTWSKFNNNMLVFIFYYHPFSAWPSNWKPPRLLLSPSLQMIKPKKLKLNHKTHLSGWMI
jgi:hypothetical protein